MEPWSFEHLTGVEMAGEPSEAGRAADAPAEKKGIGREARRRFAEIHHAIRQRICLLDYPPGERLREEDLAAEFGVSRTPLRSVLGRLEAEGLVTAVRGVGTIVTEPDYEELEQVYELRLELAELLGRMSVNRNAGHLLTELEGLGKAADALEATPRPRDFAKLNMAFFEAVMKLTANRALHEASERLYHLTTRVWVASLSADNLQEEIRHFRREILDVRTAIEYGDFVTAAKIRRTHIALSFARLKRSLQV